MKLADVTSPQTEQLINQLKSELEEDRNRWDGDAESWLESAHDCPSNPSLAIQRKIVSLVGADKYEQIMDTIISPYMVTLAGF